MTRKPAWPRAIRRSRPHGSESHRSHLRRAFGTRSALAEHKLASDYSGDEQPVFASSTGQPLNHRNVAQRGFEAAAREAGLVAEGQPRITFHDLRHAFASIMIERGLSSTVLAHVMGHCDATTTERKYIRLFNRQRTDDQVREAMQSAMTL